MATTLIPYLTVNDADGALAFYGRAFGAVETMRIAMPDGRVGHAELRLGDATIYLSDEFPEMGVTSPAHLGGTSVTMHLTVDDVDQAFATAVAAGAETLMEPADQPHGARHGTLRDPFGHRWMLSQPIAIVGAEEMAAAMGDGVTVTMAAADAVRPGVAASGATGGRRGGTSHGGIWAGIVSADAPAAIRFLVDLFGFEETLVVPGEEPGVVEHSQLAWPEGGVVQVSTAGRPGNPYADRPVGTESLYVITADPLAVWNRCVAAGVEVVATPAAPDYDPDGLVFAVRDPDGNIWSFGTYAGE